MQRPFRRGQHVFLSYRSLERAFALKLAAELRNAGVIVWVDCLQDGIRAGDDWPRTLEEALNSCRALIATLSPEYVDSKVCLRELHRADQLASIIFPVLLKPVPAEQWPLEVERLQYIDFTNWRDDPSFRQGLKLLVDRLQFETREVIGQRPDPEQQYLISLIADLEARSGVADYVALAADLLAQGHQNAEGMEEALGHVQSAFDPEFQLLEQSAQTKATRSEPKPEPKSLTNILDIIHEPTRCILLGEPGAGKTTTLRRLALEAARARLTQGRHKPLPLILQLPNWRAEPDALTFIESHWPFRADLNAALAADEVILFFDGLNEMGGQGVVKAQLIKRWILSPNAPRRLIVTCRTEDYITPLRLDIDEITVKPMDEQRIRRFTELYLQERAPSLLKRIDLGKPVGTIDQARSLLTLARNPYLLTCLIILHQKSPGVELPENPGSLFQLLTEYLWNRELIRQTRGWFPFHEAEARFAILAFKMIEEDRPTSVPRLYVSEIFGGDDAVHCGVSANILDVAGDQIKFHHQLMQEYFAAVQLYRLGSGHLPVQLEPKWSEVVIALCGIADDPDTIVLEATKTDPYLAGRCIESGVTVSAEIRERIIDDLNQELDSSVPAIKSQQREQTPQMSWSSQMMMEDAVDDYFGRYVKDLSELLHKIQQARISR